MGNGMNVMILELLKSPVLIQIVHQLMYFFMQCVENLHLCLTFIFRHS